jgi:hypothetical protein
MSAWCRVCKQGDPVRPQSRARALPWPSGTEECDAAYVRDGAAESVAQMASLVRNRNAIDERIAAITNRPVVAGHLGEWLAAQIFEVQLESSAVAKAIDGRFTRAPLAGKTVNVKWYGKREGLLDMTDSDALDYYLVFTGPKSAATTSVRGTRPMRIDGCYLFDARGLLARQIARGAKAGVAASVLGAEWDVAEIYPTKRSSVLAVGPEEAALLRLFGD